MRSYVKWKVKNEEWRIQLLSEEWRVKSEKSNSLSEDTARNGCWAKPNQTSCSRFAQTILCPSSLVLMFSCLSKNHVLLFSCLSKNMFSCSLVFQKTCSLVLLSFDRLVSVLPLFRLCKRFHAKCNGFHAFFDTTYKIS